MLWGLIILGLAAVGTTVVLLLRRRASEQRATADRRRRFTLSDTGQRVPFAAERGPNAPTQTLIEDEHVRSGTPRVSISEAPVAEGQEEPTATSIDTEAPPPGGVQGRLVNTPDGEMILTTPPFALRDSIFSNRSGRFVNALSRRVPAWVIICPRVRLDSLLTPTRPDGRDPRDWREWRRRVRVRSLDLVICDRRTWKPIVAVLFDNQRAIDARKIAGGMDRMIDEVLLHAGLPLLRLSGEFEKDWPMVAPYVEASILPHISDEALLESADRPNRIDADSAVTLLRMDQDKGWMLE